MNITEDKYYELMQTFSDKRLKFANIHDRWYACFSYVLKNMCSKYTKEVIDQLFYTWEMCNWSALHQENTEYQNFNKKQLIAEFAGDCFYICDRVSYDRLFRAHWLFRKAFDKELDAKREKLGI